MKSNLVAPFAGALALGAAVLCARAEEPIGLVTELCRAEIVAETASLKPGSDATIGVRLVLAQGWHVYWKNPGESGLAPTVAWTLPAGFEAGPLQWPTPSRVSSDGIVGYVYDRDVLFPVTLKVPATAKAGNVTISARVGWLVCRDVCEPGEATVELKIAVKDAAVVPDPSAAAAFAAAREKMPKPLAAGAATIESSDGRVTLNVTAAEPAAKDVRSVDFFPAEELVLDSAAAPAVESCDAGSLRIRLIPAPRRKDPVRRLQGVLVVGTATRSFAFEIDAAASGRKNPGTAGDKSPR